MKVVMIHHCYTIFVLHLHWDVRPKSGLI